MKNTNLAPNVSDPRNLLEIKDFQKLWSEMFYLNLKLRKGSAVRIFQVQVVEGPGGDTTLHLVKNMHDGSGTGLLTHVTFDYLVAYIEGLKHAAPFM